MIKNIIFAGLLVGGEYKFVLIRVQKVNPALILGYNDFPELYTNIFLCARKNSGKTNVI